MIVELTKEEALFLAVILEEYDAELDEMDHLVAENLAEVAKGSIEQMREMRHSVLAKLRS